MNTESEFKIALAGDSNINHRMKVNKEKDFLSLIKIFQEADVSFMNMEGLVHEFEGYPIGPPKGDSYHQADPIIADDLKWAGFDIVSTANNHVMDYSVPSMIANSKHLDRVGIAHAGTGMNLTLAREPCYLDTKGGIVALVAATTSILGRAGEPRKDVRGRPGVNAIRCNSRYVLTKESFISLKEIVKKLGLLRIDEIDTEEFTFLRNKFVCGDEFKVEVTMNKIDLVNNLKVVEDARRQADWVLVSLHFHDRSTDPPPGLTGRQYPPRHIQSFARACVERGADIFIGHGTHVLQGIEVFKNKPIFYGLSNFIFQSTLAKRQAFDLFERWGLGINDSTADLYEKREAPPAHFFEEPEYWESIIAECIYEDRKLTQLKLFPITLCYDKNKPLKEQRTKAGTPKLADRTLGKKIIQDMIKLSSPFGTKIEYSDNLGIIQILS